MKATRERKAQLRRVEAAGQAGKRGGKRVHESSDPEGALASEASRWRVGGAELGAGD